MRNTLWNDMEYCKCKSYWIFSILAALLPLHHNWTMTRRRGEMTCAGVIYKIGVLLDTFIDKVSLMWKLDFTLCFLEVSEQEAYPWWLSSINATFPWLHLHSISISLDWSSIYSKKVSTENRAFWVCCYLSVIPAQILWVFAVFFNWLWTSKVIRSLQWFITDIECPLIGHWQDGSHLAASSDTIFLGSPAEIILRSTINQIESITKLKEKNVFGLV